MFSTKHIAGLSATEQVIVLAGLVLAAVLGGVIVLLIPEIPTLELAIIIKSCLILLVLILPILLRIRYFDLFAPNVIMSLWMGALFAIRPLYLYANQQAGVWWKIRLLYIGIENIGYAQNVAFLSLAGISLGYYLPRQVRLRASASIQTHTQPAVPVWALVAYVASAPISMLLLVFTLGFDRILVYAGRISQIMGGHYYLSLGFAALDVATLVLWTQLAPRGRRSPIFWLLVLASTVVNLLLGARAGILVIWFSLWIISNYDDSRENASPHVLRRTLIAVMLIATAILILAVIPVVRTTAEALDRPDLVQERITLEVLPNLGGKVMDELIPFDFFVIKMAQMRDSPTFLYGETFLRVLYYVIPRSIWPDKPLPIGFEVGLDLYGIEVGTPITLLGELYVNFGFPGVFLGSFLLAFILRMLYERLQNEPDNYILRITYAFTIANLYIIISRSLSTVIVQFIIYLVLLRVLFAIANFSHQISIQTRTTTFALRK